MGMKLEWVLTCEKCGKTHREKARTLDLIFDSNPVPVKWPPEAPGWETDCLGGWLCRKCHAEWLKAHPPRVRARPGKRRKAARRLDEQLSLKAALEYLDKVKLRESAR